LNYLAVTPNDFDERYRAFAEMPLTRLAGTALGVAVVSW
jgi:hypothetical protein